MPIYEYFSPDTNRIYSFYAKTLAQGKLTPGCPDRPGARMVKLLSSFAVGGAGKKAGPGSLAPNAAGASGPVDARMEAAMGAMEKEFARVDENDPRAMARMMRRMAELSGERLDGPMDEAVRKLEEGADPDSIEEQMGEVFGPEGEGGPPGDGPAQPGPDGKRESKGPGKVRRLPPDRDPKLYDYE
jgi:hypothetical protein